MWKWAANTRGASIVLAHSYPLSVITKIDNGENTESNTDGITDDGDVDGDADDDENAPKIKKLFLRPDVKWSIWKTLCTNTNVQTNKQNNNRTKRREKLSVVSYYTREKQEKKKQQQYKTSKYHRFTMRQMFKLWTFNAQHNHQHFMKQ